MILTPALGSQRTPGALVPIAACFFTLEADGPTPGWLEGGDLGGQCREDDIWDFGYKVSPAGALSHSASGACGLAASRSLCKEVLNGPNHLCVCTDKITVWYLINLIFD